MSFECATLDVPLKGDADSVTPDLSIVLPCYRAPELARSAVAQLESFLEPLACDYEIIIVDDGGGDVSRAQLGGSDRVRLIAMPTNRGKGAAVRIGLLSARGRARVFTDIDIPYDPELFLIIARYLVVHKYHLVVGDRTLPGSSYAHDVGWRRRLASSAFSFLVGRIVTGGFFDTQCGLKGIRGDVAEVLLPLTCIDRFAFDVELLYVALKSRLDIKRIPVQLRRNETSSINLLRDSARMLADTLRLKYLQLRGQYDSEALNEIVSVDFEREKSSLLATVPQRHSHAQGRRHGA